MGDQRLPVMLLLLGFGASACCRGDGDCVALDFMIGTILMMDDEHVIDESMI